MPVIVGLTSKPRAGKGTTLILLKEIIAREINEALPVQSSRFSDVLREMCTEQGLPHTRDNLQKIAQNIEQEGIRRGNGPGALSREVKKRIENLDARVIIVDGVRWLTDEQLIRSFEKNFLIFVTATLETRYTRALKAAENVGDATKSFEEFVLEDNAHNEKFVEEIGARADVRLENDAEDETFGNLRKQLLSFFRGDMFHVIVEES